MQNFDLCFAWNWQYDADFTGLLATACQDQNLSLYQVTSANLEHTLHSLNSNQMCFRAFFDRASDTDDRFNQLVDWASRQASVRINPFGIARRAWDKAAMHHQVLQARLEAPLTFVLPSFQDMPCLSPPDLRPLGERFAIKPAHGGGGKGVVTGATTWEQVLYARQEYPADQYLLQAHVDPVDMDGRPAWFRILYCAGKAFPCWWDPASHIYSPLCEAELNHYCLHYLHNIVTGLAQICKLELFSTEVALTSAGRFMIVDYINDPVDLRLQSKVAGGVPDDIVATIARQLVDFVAARCYTHFFYTRLLVS